MNYQKPLDGLNEFGNKRIEVKLKNNSSLIGVLKSFDYNLHLVLHDAEELMEDKKTKFGTVLIRGNNVVSVHVARSMQVSREAGRFVMMEEIEVTNCVVSCDTHSRFVLEQLATDLYQAEYNPESFPGLVYRISEPRASILIFSTGKLICSGAKSLEDATIAVKKIVNDIRKVGVEVSDRLDIQVVNMVASADLGHKLDLSAIVFGLSECEYEPEQFPGVVHRIHDPKVVFLLFSSGRIVITGARSLKDVERGIKNLRKELKGLGIG